MKPVRLVSIPLFALTLVAGCSKHSEEVASIASKLPPARVHLGVVQREQLPSLVELTGTVRPVKRALLASKVMGVIGELPVSLGQQVRTGDLLAKINAAEIGARVAQAESQLKQAQRDLDRERDLLSKNASTADLVKSLEDRAAMTRAALNEAEAMLSYTLIRAPFDGVVSRKLANAGDLASPGFPLIEVEGADAFEIEVSIPESLALQSGASSVVRVQPPLGPSFPARISELSSASDVSARNVLAKVAVPAGQGLRSGQFVRIQLEGTPADMMLVPATAVLQVGQLERVFVMKDAKALLRLVKTGAHRGNRVEILSGLAQGDRVVIQPSAELIEGQNLEVQP